MPIEPQEYRRAAACLSAWRRPLIVTHARADGDAIGSVATMRAIVRRGGARPIAMLFEPPADKYARVCRGDPLDVWATSVSEADLAGVDGVLVVDTCAYTQLEPIAAWLQGAAVPKIALDHHQTRDVRADVYLIDEAASAACLLVYDWCAAADWPLDAGLARTLWVGISTDTGWFRFSNTDARTLAAASHLVSLGLHVDDLYRDLFENESAARVRLLGAAVGSLELHAADRLAVMTITREMLERCGAKRSDTEDLINVAMRIGTVEVAILLTEDDGGITRASFRSKKHVDVASLAAQFGGGGHARAAGARLAAPLAHAKATVIAQAQEAMRSTSC